MNTMARWQLKGLAKDQLRGHWGEMALRTFVMYLIPIGIFGTVIILSVMGAAFRLGLQNLHRFELEDMGAYGIPLVIFAVLLTIALIIFVSVMYCGYIEGFMKLRVGQESSMNILFSKFKMIPKLLGYAFYYILINIPMYVLDALTENYNLAVLDVISFAVSLLYIYISIRLTMALFILVENPYTKVWTAFKQSWFIMKGHCWKFFLLGLSFFGWAILSVFTLYIGILWLVPYMTMTTLNFYYDLKNLHYGTESEVEFAGGTDGTRDNW